MKLTSLVVRAAFALLIGLSTSCSSCSSSDSEPIPGSVESGFEFATDAFVFANFGGDTSPRLTPALMARMFGPEVACESVEPCKLRASAKLWMESTNATLDQGRSEGFAMLSLAFFTGELDPNDFGGVNVADLRIDGNYALQQEFAYWAATQAVPSAGTADERFEARDVMPFLAKVLAEDSEERYRIAIAQKTATGFTRGHALTPIGFYRVEDGAYMLRVYDNNFPQKERRLFIDPKNNVWRYEVPALDGETILYEGNAENGNQLYFAPLSQRTGVLEAPFGEGSEFVALTSAGVTVVASDGEGGETGIRDGVVIEAEGERVTPAFSRCPLCGTPVPIVNQALLDRGVRSRSVEITGDSGVSTTDNAQEDEAFVSGTGDGFSSTVYMGDESFGDTVSFSEDGSVTYKAANNDDGITIKTTYTDDDGNSSTIEVKVDASSSDAEVSVSKDDEGKLVVEVDGLPEGTSVSVKTTTENEDGEEVENGVTYTSNGSKSTAKVTPGEEKFETENVGSITAEHCTNETKDDGLESDVDCGGQCGATCVDNKVCETNGDCVGGNCEDGTCQTIDCTNGVVSPGETDVDCGGPNCSKCEASFDASTAPSCASDSDCDSGFCSDGKCLKKAPVYVRVTNTTAPNLTVMRVTVKLDGVDKVFNLDPAKVFDDPMANGYLGDARDVQFVSGFNCIGSNVPQTTGYTAQGDTTAEAYIDLQCPEANQKTATLYLDKDTSILPGISADDPVRVAVSLDGGPETVWELSGSQYPNVGFYENEWKARIVRSPIGVFGNGGTYDFYLRCPLVAYRRSEVVAWDINELVAPEGVDALFIECKRGTLTIQDACTDLRRNRDESDRDCGGQFCAPCDQRRRCNDGNDCIAGASCTDGYCFVAGTCSDSTWNNGEGDIDCGGTCSTKCISGNNCFAESDCGTGLTCKTSYVPEFSQVCTPDSCVNQTKDSTETDVDCGGPCVEKCTFGEGCSSDVDCGTGLLCGPNDTCQTDLCRDGKKSGDETDVDCGGSCTAKCAVGETCSTSGDCQGGNPCLGSVCTNPQCINGSQDGSETDVDCGGSDCPSCDEFEGCSQDSDCSSGFSCQSNTCRLTSCANATTDGDETDVDCGGARCGPCSAGQTCSMASDCDAASTCISNQCSGLTCNNGVQDGGEADVDCGTVCINKCQENDSCGSDLDCASGLECANNQCRDASCFNGVQDANETDVDCGGSCSTGCPTGGTCLQSSDCAAGICNAMNVCEASLCMDGVKNQDETGVDCGGSNCPACPISESCTVDSDCATSDCECGVNSGNCTGASGVCGAGKWIFDQPTSDGVTPSGTATIPAQCTSVYVQVWGAAGGTGDLGMGTTGAPGGAGGFVSGTLTVSQNDVLTAWVAQGGDTDRTGNAGNGSLYGTPATGGDGDNNLFAGGGASGGGLTSLQQSGSATTSFLVPGGGGGDAFTEGEDVTAGSGGGAGMPSGEDAGSGSGLAGGGAGADGGTTGAAGTYGPLPAGLSSQDGTFGQPAATSNADYQNCLGVDGTANAGASDMFFTQSGDGCVVIRCVAP